MNSQIDTSLNEILSKILTWYNNLDQIQQAIVVILIAKIIRDHSPKTYYYSKPKPIPRNNFTESTKNLTLMKQGFVCNSCKKPSKLWDFHHKDGDRSNNHSSNCEALCPYCHAEKTRRKN